MNMDSLNINSKIKRIVITESEIKQKIAEVGADISKRYVDKPLLLVSILKGAFIFMSDLCRAITIPCEISFMAVQSYFDSTVSSGKVNITLNIGRDISKYHVIIVEDIIDTGRTLNEIIKIMKKSNPLSLEIITLLDKPARREIELEADTSLFKIDDLFVIGYGLDCGELYRNLPYIAEYDSDNN